MPRSRSPRGPPPRDLDRGPPRDLPRGPPRDMPRGPPRDLPRGPPRDLPRGSSRDGPPHSRGPPRDGPPRDGGYSRDGPPRSRGSTGDYGRPRPMSPEPPRGHYEARGRPSDRYDDGYDRRPPPDRYRSRSPVMSREPPTYSREMSLKTSPFLKFLEIVLLIRQFFVSSIPILTSYSILFFNSKLNSRTILNS